MLRSVIYFNIRLKINNKNNSLMSLFKAPQLVFSCYCYFHLVLSSLQVLVQSLTARNISRNSTITYWIPVRFSFVLTTSQLIIQVNLTFHSIRLTLFFSYSFYYCLLWLFWVISCCFGLYLLITINYTRMTRMNLLLVPVAGLFFIILWLPFWWVINWISWWLASWLTVPWTLNNGEYTWWALHKADIRFLLFPVHELADDVLMVGLLGRLLHNLEDGRLHR